MSAGEWARFCAVRSLEEIKHALMTGRAPNGMTVTGIQGMSDLEFLEFLAMRPETRSRAVAEALVNGKAYMVGPEPRPGRRDRFSGRCHWCGAPMPEEREACETCSENFRSWGHRVDPLGRIER